MPPFCFDFSKFSGGERRAFGARRTRLADRNLLLLPPIILYKLSAYTSFQPSYATEFLLQFHKFYPKRFLIHKSIFDMNTQPEGVPELK